MPCDVGLEPLGAIVDRLVDMLAGEARGSVGDSLAGLRSANPKAGLWTPPHLVLISRQAGPSRMTCPADCARAALAEAAS